MNTYEKLMRLDQALGEVPDEHFDMRVWYRRSGDSPPEGWDCGTAACALGHACFIPEFVAEGLHLEKRGGNFYPTFGDSAGVLAASFFFGVTWEQAYDLFNPEDLDSITRDQVRARIQELAESYKPVEVS